MKKAGARASIWNNLPESSTFLKQKSLITITIDSQNSVEKNIIQSRISFSFYFDIYCYTWTFIIYVCKIFLKLEG